LESDPNYHGKIVEFHVYPAGVHALNAPQTDPAAEQAMAQDARDRPLRFLDKYLSKRATSSEPAHVREISGSEFSATCETSQPQILGMSGSADVVALIQALLRLVAVRFAYAGSRPASA
jgi:hypothetical protein